MRCLSSHQGTHKTSSLFSTINNINHTILSVYLFNIYMYTYLYIYVYTICVAILIISFLRLWRNFNQPGGLARVCCAFNLSLETSQILRGAVRRLQMGITWYNNGEVSPHKLGYHLHDYSDRSTKITGTVLPSWQLKPWCLGIQGPGVQAALEKAMPGPAKCL
jgi:hypothetical protein